MADEFVKDSLEQGASRWEATLLASLTVTAVAFIGAFLLTIPSRPPMPKVEIDIKNKDKDVSGTLLTHAESFWYVFEQQSARPESRLTAIPDDQVKSAHVSKATSTE